MVAGYALLAVSAARSLFRPSHFAAHVDLVTTCCRLHLSRAFFGGCATRAASNLKKKPPPSRPGSRTRRSTAVAVLGFELHVVAGVLAEENRAPPLRKSAGFTLSLP